MGEQPLGGTNAELGRRRQQLWRLEGATCHASDHPTRHGQRPVTGARACSKHVPDLERQPGLSSSRTACSGL